MGFSLKLTLMGNTVSLLEVLAKSQLCNKFNGLTTLINSEACLNIKIIMRLYIQGAKQNSLMIARNQSAANRP
jgi:hypothetical protein